MMAIQGSVELCYASFNQDDIEQVFGSYKGKEQELSDALVNVSRALSQSAIDLASPYENAHFKAFSKRAVEWLRKRQDTDKAKLVVDNFVQAEMTRIRNAKALVFAHPFSQSESGLHHHLQPGDLIHTKLAIPSYDLRDKDLLYVCELLQDENLGTSFETFSNQLEAECKKAPNSFFAKIALPIRDAFITKYPGLHKKDALYMTLKVFNLIDTFKGLDTRATPKQALYALNAKYMHQGQESFERFLQGFLRATSNDQSFAQKVALPPNCPFQSFRGIANFAALTQKLKGLCRDPQFKREAQQAMDQQRSPLFAFACKALMLEA